MSTSAGKRSSTNSKAPRVASTGYRAPSAPNAGSATSAAIGDTPPFTAAEFAASLRSMASLSSVGATQGANTAGIARLGGKDYLVKQISARVADDSHSTPERMAQNEVAAVRMAQALNMTDTVPDEAYVMNHAGGVYSVQRFHGDMQNLADEGSAGARTVSAGRSAAFDRANAGDIGMKRLMFEYLTGANDRHLDNYLFNPASGGVRLIDFGREFETQKGFDPITTGLGSAVMRAHGEHPSAGRYGNKEFSAAQMRQVSISPAAIHSFTSRASALSQALETHLSPAAKADVMARMNVLNEIAAMEHPTVYDWVKASNEFYQG